MDPVVSEVISTVKTVIGDFSKENPVHLHEPDFINTNAKNY